MLIGCKLNINLGINTNTYENEDTYLIGNQEYTEGSIEIDLSYITG